MQLAGRQHCSVLCVETLRGERHLLVQSTSNFMAQSPPGSRSPVFPTQHNKIADIRYLVCCNL
jgi:hypothetical protein